MLLLDLFLVGLAAVAGGWICRRFGVPEVLGYLGAGILLGPHAHATSFVQDVGTVRAIATFAIVFRMFSLGLEFDARRLAGRWRAALFAGGFEMGLCTLAGIALAPVLGWSLLEGAILGAALGTTSTNILNKALADRNMANREDARAAGAATLAEDLLAMTLVATLAVFHGASTPGEVIENALWLVVFASLALTAGAILLPLGIERLARSRSDELLTLAVIGVLFGFAALSEALGAGRPVGAFLAGIAVGAARHAPGLSTRIFPLRDVLAAMFYVSAGLLLDPRLVIALAPTAALVALAFIPLKVIATGIGLRLGGVAAPTAARAGAILGQAGTLGIVVAMQPFLGPGAFERLFAFAFVAWALTVALTPARLRWLPDICERLVVRRASRPAPRALTRLPRRADAALRSDASIAVLAAGCALALAALAAIAGHSFLLFLPAWAIWPAAAFVGTLAGAGILPFAMLVGGASRHAMRQGIHQAALTPSRLTRGSGDRARTWSRAGTLVGILVVASASAGLGFAIAPGALRIFLLGGALFAVVALALRPRMLERLIEKCHRLVASRPIAPESRLHDMRGTAGASASFDVEAVPVAAGTRAAWASVASLGLRDATGASVVAVVRAGVPIVLDEGARIHPGDRVVVGGTSVQVVAARAHLLEPAVDPAARTAQRVDSFQARS